MDALACEVYFTLVERLYANKEYPVNGGLDRQKIFDQIVSGERERALTRVLYRIGRDGWDSAIRIARNCNLNKYAEEIYRVFSSALFILRKACGKFFI